MSYMSDDDRSVAITIDTNNNILSQEPPKYADSTSKKYNR